MVKQHQIFDSHFLRDFHAFEPRRVAPALARRRQLFGSELRVVDKNVRARRQFPQTLIQLRIARLIIGGVDDDSGRSFKSEPEAALRMVQPARRHARARQLNWSPPLTSVNSRFAHMALRSTGKYG